METTKTTYQDDEFEIDLLEVLRALKKRIWLILLAAVLGGGIFGAFSKFVLVPQYQSTAMLYVLSKETTLTSLADLRKPAYEGLSGYRYEPAGFGGCDFGSWH